MLGQNMIHSEPAAHQNGHGQGPLDVPGRVVGGGDVDGDSGGTVVPVMGEESESVPLHPLGVKPLGNRYLSGGPDARSACGSFQALPDETIMTLLEYLGADELRRLGYTCKFLFAFCHLDDLWKTLFLEYV